MGLLKTRERTPAQEAERQAQIATEVQRQHDEQLAYERELTVQNARRRAELWAERQQEAEDRRMSAMAREQEARRERDQRLREQRLKLDAAKMTEYKEAKAAFDAVKAELDGLRAAPDLATDDGRRQAVDQELRKTALKEILAAADRRLISAERAVGRHRGGGI